MRTRNCWICVTALVSAAAAGPACSKSEEFRVTRLTDRGVEIVKNPAQPLHKNASLKIEPELVFGRAAGGNDPFATVDSFAVARDGTVYVCDERAARIRVCDTGGRIREVIDTAAPDLGALERPQIVGLTAAGELAVESSGHGKVVFYDGDGGVLRTTSLAAYNAFRLGVDSRGRLLIHYYRYVRPNMIYYLKWFDAEMNELKTLGQYWEPQSVMNDFYAFLPILWWEIGGADKVVYGYPQRYELEIFGADGAPLRKIRKEHAPAPITEEEKTAYRKEYAKAPYLRIHFPEVHSAFQKFTVDERGWIIVMTWERPAGGEGTWYDVFDDTGLYTARVVLTRMPQLWTGGRLYSLERTESGSVVLTRNTYAWSLK